MRQMYQNLRRLLAAVSLLFVVGFVHAQITVTGTVIDGGKLGNGMPLPGATVRVKGTTTGAQTDFDGKFSIKVPDGNAELEFTFVGYQPIIKKVGDKTKIDVVMKEGATDIKEVTAVGYAVQKKSDVTGAISTLGGDDLNSRPVMGVDQAMQGKVGGVQIRNNSGSPGGGTMINIRGVGTINDAEPLYVVDGVPSESIKNLNPGDIKSISVLKDASSCAIYGSRGANGVIIITTKEGKMGGGSAATDVISVDVSQGYQMAWKKLDVLNAEEHQAMLARLGKKVTYPEYATLTGAGTNWQDQVFRVAPLTRAQISLDGGSEKNSYSTSFSYNKQSGIIKGSDYDRITFRMKATHKLYKRLTAGEGLYVNSTNRDQLNEGGLYSGNVLWHALLMDPEMPVRMPNVDPSTNSDMPNAIVTNGGIRNPLRQLELNHQTTKTKDYGFNVWGEYEFVKNLKFKSQFSYANWYAVYENYVPKFYMRGNWQNEVSKDTKSITDGHNTTLSNTLSYNFDVKSKSDSTMVAHSFSFLVGQEVFQQLQLLEQSTTYDYLYDDQVYLNMARKDTLAIDKYTRPIQEGLYSYLGRVNYSFKDRYLVTGNIRRDGSSKFLGNNKWGTFPSFSLGWKISQEDFFKNSEKLRFINELKLRVGWGRIGNQKVDGSRVYSTMRSDFRSYPLGVSQTSITGTTVNLAANPDLRWETSQSLNVGLDVSFLKNKFTFQVDYFDKSTTDMLIDIPLPLTNGGEFDPANAASYPSILKNVGKNNNVGVEASLTFRDDIKGKVNYEISGNITAVKNKVTDLSGRDFIFSGIDPTLNQQLSITQQGYSIADFYGYVADGIYTSYAEINQGPKRSEVLKVGDTKFKDLNGDGVIDEKDKTHIGSPLPKFTYGLTFSADGYGFDISASIMGSYGNKIFNATKFYTYGASAESVVNYSKDYYLNSWSKDNQGGTLPARGDVANYNMPSTNFVEDGSYIRLKDIVLGYTIPTIVTSKLKVNKIRLYGQIQNLITITKYSGFDPEIGKLESQKSSNLEIGIDRATYPQARTFVFGVNLVF